MQQIGNLSVIFVKMLKSQRHITAVYNEYSQMLYATALRIVGNSQEAEDIMQETIIQYYNSFRLVRIKKIGGYLKTICIRKSIDLLRERRRNEDFLKENLAENIGINLTEKSEEELEEKVINNLKSIELIKDNIILLPDGYRTILSLYLFEGYDYTEIAQILGISESGVRSQYMRGKKRLLDLIQNETQKQNKRE